MPTGCWLVGADLLRKLREANLNGLRHSTMFPVSDLFPSLAWCQF